MPTFDYAAFAQRASSLMTKYGETRYLRRASVDRPCIAVEWTFTPREIDGQLIRRTDRRFIVSRLDPDGAALSPQPSADDDTFIVNGEADGDTTTELMLVSPPERVAPAGIVVCWVLHVRNR